jgi:hypothetical protein
MKTLIIRTSSLICLLLLTVISSSFADDDGLDARTSVKVNKAKRHQALEQKKQGEIPTIGNTNFDNSKDPCAGVDIGNVYTDGKRGPAPRENTVVVTGDVINIPSNKCR